MKRHHSLLLLLAVVSQLFSAGSIASAESIVVVVVDALDRSPIEGAFVMVGPGKDVPFPGNVRYTGPSGTAAFTHPLLQGPQTVTAGADSFAFTAVYEAAVQEVVLPLYRAFADTTLGGTAVRITGRVDGISNIDNDGFFDVGIVLPAVGIDQVLGTGRLPFHIPIELVEFPIVGQIEFPGNVVMPRQTEFFLLTFEKRNFLLDLPGQTTQQVYSLHARIPTDYIIDPPEDGNIFNAATMREVGIRRNVLIEEGLDLRIDSNMGLVRTLRVTVEEAPNGSMVTATSAASILGPEGEELVVGYDIKQELADQHDLLELASRNPGGDLADAQNFVVGAYGDSSAYLEYATIRVNRTPFNLPATRVLRNFYDPPDVSQDHVRFSWGPVHDPGTEPEPTWALSMIRLAPIDPADSTVVQQLLWSVIVPAEKQGYALPSLPAGAPGPPGGLIDVDLTPEADRLVLDVNVANPSGSLAEVLVTPTRDVTHLSRRSVTLLVDPASVPPDAGVVRAGVARARPNPSSGPVTLTFGSSRPEPGEAVAILDVTGRLIRRLSPAVEGEDLVWDGADERGLPVAPGIYLLVTGEGTGRKAGKIHRIR